MKNNPYELDEDGNYPEEDDIKTNKKQKPESLSKNQTTLNKFNKNPTQRTSRQAKVEEFIK